MYMSGEYSLWNLSALFPSLALHYIFFPISFWQITFMHVHNIKYHSNLSEPTGCFKCDCWFVLQDLSFVRRALQSAWASSFFWKADVPWTDWKAGIKGQGLPLQFRTCQSSDLSYPRWLNWCVSSLNTYQASKGCSASFFNPCSLSFSHWHEVILYDAMEMLNGHPVQWLKHVRASGMQSNSFYALLSPRVSLCLNYVSMVQ